MRDWLSARSEPTARVLCIVRESGFFDVDRRTFRQHENSSNRSFVVQGWKTEHRRDYWLTKQNRIENLPTDNTPVSHTQQQMQISKFTSEKKKEEKFDKVQYVFPSIKIHKSCNCTKAKGKSVFYIQIQLSEIVN